MKHFLRLSITLISIALGGCMGTMEIGMPHVEEIMHGYYTSSSIDHTAISKIDNKSPYAPGRYLIYGVQDLDWNDRFIIVKSIEYPKRSSTDVLTWYIIDAINDQIFGPFYYDEYIQERENLAVSDEIELLKPKDPEWEVYRRKQPQRSKDTTSPFTNYMPFIGGAFAVGLLLIAIGLWRERSKQ